MSDLTQNVLEVATVVDWQFIVERVVWAGGGALVGLATAYVGLIRDVSFIKGQVGELVKQHREVSDLQERVQALELEILHGN